MSKRRLALAEQAKRLQEEFNKTVEEEERLLKDSEELVNKALEGRDIFCGVILGPDDIGPIVKAMVENQGQVRIGFKIYLDEK